MGKQKLKLSSVKSYRKKRKARLAARLAPTSSSNQATDLIVSLPRAQSFTQLCDHFSKNDIPGWKVVESTSERLSLAEVKFSPSPRISVSVQISSTLEYCVTFESYTISLPHLGTPVGSRISCINDVMVLLNKIGSFHLCEGNLCSEFSDVVVHNKGKFYGTDRKLFKTLSNFINYIF